MNKLTSSNHNNIPSNLIAGGLYRNTTLNSKDKPGGLGWQETKWKAANLVDKYRKIHPRNKTYTYECGGKYDGRSCHADFAYIFVLFFYDCFCNTGKCSYPVKRRPKCFKGDSFITSRAMRSLTCRAQYTAKYTSNFNLVRDVLVCGDIQANPSPRKTKPSPKYHLASVTKQRGTIRSHFVC